MPVVICKAVTDVDFGPLHTLLISPIVIIRSHFDTVRPSRHSLTGRSHSRRILAAVNGEHCWHWLLGIRGRLGWIGGMGVIPGAAGRDRRQMMYY